MCDSVPRAPSCLDRLAFSFEGRKPCILNGLKKQTSGHGAHPGAFASLSLHGSTNSTHRPEFPETASAFTPQQLWLQEQLGKIPVFARFAEQAKEQAREHREMKETERVWKGQVVKESKAPLQPPVTKEKKKKVMVNRPKDLSVSDAPIWDLFVELDADGNGALDEGEISVGLERMGLPSSPMAVVQLMGQFDEGGSGTISWSEFRSCVKRRDAEIREVFRSFDLDGNGEITGSEMQKAMAAAGLPVTGKDVSRIMRKLDKNFSSSLNYEEFRRFACLVPTIYKNEGDSIRAWLASNAKPRSSSKRALQKIEFTNTTSQFLFVAFDLGLRASLAIALVAAALYITSQE